MAKTPPPAPAPDEPKPVPPPPPPEEPPPPADPTPEIVEYPRWLYHTDGARQIVQTETQAKALGAGWSTTPPKE